MAETPTLDPITGAPLNGANNSGQKGWAAQTINLAPLQYPAGFNGGTATTAPLPAYDAVTFIRGLYLSSNPNSKDKTPQDLLQEASDVQKYNTRDAAAGVTGYSLAGVLGLSSFALPLGVLAAGASFLSRKRSSAPQPDFVLFTQPAGENMPATTWAIEPSKDKKTIQFVSGSINDKGEFKKDKNGAALSSEQFLALINTGRDETHNLAVAQNVLRVAVHPGSAQANFVNHFIKQKDAAQTQMTTANQNQGGTGPKDTKASENHNDSPVPKLGGEQAELASQLKLLVEERWLYVGRNNALQPEFQGTREAYSAQAAWNLLTGADHLGKGNGSLPRKVADLLEPYANSKGASRDNQKDNPINNGDLDRLLADHLSKLKPEELAKLKASMTAAKTAGETAAQNAEQHKNPEQTPTAGTTSVPKRSGTPHKPAGEKPAAADPKKVSAKGKKAEKKQDEVNNIDKKTPVKSDKKIDFSMITTTKTAFDDYKKVYPELAKTMKQSYFGSGANVPEYSKVYKDFLNNPGNRDEVMKPGAQDAWNNMASKFNQLSTEHPEFRGALNDQLNKPSASAVNNFAFKA